MAAKKNSQTIFGNLFNSLTLKVKKNKKSIPLVIGGVVLAGIVATLCFSPIPVVPAAIAVAAISIGLKPLILQSILMVGSFVFSCYLLWSC